MGTRFWPNIHAFRNPEPRVTSAPSARNACATLPNVQSSSRDANGADEAAALVRTSSCVTRAIAGETLVIPIARATADLESIFTLNPVASRIWELLESPVAPSRLVQTIEREFDVSHSDAVQDVGEFLDSLRAAGLIAPVEG